MRRIFYDTEFIDDGTTIELISIGMVSDNGDEYYAINGELSISRLWDIDWHRENTIPSLPIERVGDNRPGWLLDHSDSAAIKSRTRIREEVAHFIFWHSDGDAKSIADSIELWAWYGAYDHVALAQLWGPMMKLPYQIVPMYTNDLKQELERKIQLTDNKRLRYELPQMAEEGTVHNALADARLLKRRFEWLSGIS